MENKYDKNMEALLQKAFLAQDLNASKNEGLLAASSKATLGNVAKTSFFSAGNLFKGLFFLATLVGLVFGWSSIFRVESKYIPAEFIYELPKGQAEELERIPTLAALELKKIDIEKEIKTIALLIRIEDTEEEKEIKIYEPEKEPYELKTLSADGIKEHFKEKEKFIKDVLKLDKKKFSKIETANHTIMKGEKALDNFVIWKTEISNAEYRLFLNDLIVHNRMADYQVAAADSAAWTNFGNENFFELMSEMYHAYSAYDDYPAVNISRDGAILYCRWLSAEIEKNDDSKSEIQSIRIPTNREWEYAASSGGKMKPYPWGGPYLTNSEGCYLANFRPGRNTKTKCAVFNIAMDDFVLNDSTKWNDFNADGGFLTVKVGSYNPNGFGIYNVAGNVAEMVSYPYNSDDIGAKGGDWFSNGNFLKIYGTDPFMGVSEPRSNIGFRPVITYKAVSTISKVYNEVMSNPTLSTEEISKNNKRKEERINRIIKIDHDYYTNLLYGNMDLKGDKVRVDNIIVNRFEVSVIDYKTFLFDLIIQKRFDEFHTIKPKYETWRLDSNFYKTHVRDYLIHSAYDNRPILNISVEGAELYCKWLFEETKKADARNKVAPLKAIRIPTYEEWMFLATEKGSRDNLDVVTKHQALIDADSTVFFRNNFKSGRNSDEELRDHAIFTGSIYKSGLSEMGMYNILGNAAEMVRYQDGEYGSKGGSWNSDGLGLHFYAEDKTKGKSQANGETGFRFVLEWDRSSTTLAPVQLKPQLTEEQIKATKKNKANMLSALLKLDKDYYSVLPVGVNQDSLADFQMGKFEVTNKEYRTFLFDLIVQGRFSEFENSKPDQSLWNTVTNEHNINENINGSYSEFYFMHEAYDMYPVVNISRQGCELFCSWLFAEAKKVDKRNAMKPFKMVRLPKDQEWITVAGDFGKLNKYPWEGDKLYSPDKRGNQELNVVFNVGLGKGGSIASVTNINGVEIYHRMFPVNRGLQTTFGVWNIAGNVAEMVKYNDGTYGSRGGSWNSTAEEIEIYAPDKTKGNLEASPMIGFRYVIEWEPIKNKKVKKGN